MPWKHHTIFSECSMDNAGEQSSENKEFQQAMLDRIGSMGEASMATSMHIG